MKVIRLRNHITVILEDGTMITNTKCTDEMYNEVLANQENEEQVLEILVPEYSAKVEEFEFKEDLIKSMENSTLITFENGKAYLRDISNLVLPEELATAIVEAENTDNEDALQSYKNFWTLCSLNPNAEARKNLFWFLRKYGMKISRSGLFVAYRNVNLKKDGKEVNSKLAEFISSQYTRVKFKLKKAPSNYYVGYLEGVEESLGINIDSSKLKQVLGRLDDLYFKLSDDNLDDNNSSSSPVYTDAYTGRFKIKIGKPVSMKRSLCDENQNITCSKGLHVAGKSWLSEGYYGQQSIMCLVNPADVVAVPPYDNYGKMRTCAYFPVQLIQRDEDNNIIEENFPDGFEDDFMKLIAYEGTKNEAENLKYTIEIPQTPELNRQNIISKLDSISKSLSKYVN